MGLRGRVLGEDDLDALIAARGLRQRAAPLVDPVKGFLFQDVIVVAASLTRGERMAVKAHELGHYVLHEGNHFFLSSFPSTAQNMTSRYERQANAFAGTLLLGDPWGGHIDERMGEAFDQGIPPSFLFTFVNAAFTGAPICRARLAAADHWLEM